MRPKTPCTRCGAGDSAEELDLLRSVIDETIRDLDSEITAPRVIDDDGTLRALTQRAVSRLRAARRAAA